jgi:negative regulator of replication initiation
LHFQAQTQRLGESRRKVQQMGKIEAENRQLEEDIRKVRELLHSSLLESEKAKLISYFSG